MNPQDRLDLIRGFEPTDDELQRMVNYRKPTWAKRDFHSWSKAFIKIDENDPRGAKLASIRTFEGGTSPIGGWADDVLFTAGPGARSKADARENIREAAFMAIDSLREAERRREQIAGLDHTAHDN